MRFLQTKRFWKRLFFGLAIVVAVGLIANGVLAWRMEKHLQARFAAIRAAGDPATIAELAPPAIPDEENAAVILQRIEPRLSEFSKEYARFSNSSLGEKHDALHDRGEPATSEQIDAIRAILNKYPDVEQALAAAAKCDKYGSRLDFSLGCNDFLEQMIATQGYIRTAARLLGWRMEFLLADGQRDQAVERGVQTFRLARLYESEPTIVPLLVAIAMRGLVVEQIYDAFASGPVSPDVQTALDEELARIDDPQRLVHTLKTDRAVSGNWSEPILETPFPALARIFSGIRKSYQVGVIDCTNEYLRMVGPPWHEVRAPFGEADSPSPPSGHGAMADMLSGALRATFQANARSVAVSRALRVYISLRKFKEQNGREATELAEIDLPKAATIDPYTGEPLKLKLIDDGWMIYSVMTNGTDDGGDFKARKDYGVAPRKWRGTE